MNRLLDWLDLHDYGYPLGLTAMTGSGVAALCELWWFAEALLILAAVLCWGFG